MSSNSVCNHTRDQQIGLPLHGRPILLSLVRLQTELDSTQSYYHYLLNLANLTEAAFLGMTYILKMNLTRITNFLRKETTNINSFFILNLSKIGLLEKLRI